MKNNCNRRGRLFTRCWIQMLAFLAITISSITMVIGEELVVEDEEIISFFDNETEALEPYYDDKYNMYENPLAANDNVSEEDMLIEENADYLEENETEGYLLDGEADISEYMDDDTLEEQSENINNYDELNMETQFAQESVKMQNTAEMEENADDFNPEKIGYSYNYGMCGDNLSWVLDLEGTLTISGTGDMINWRLPEDCPWFNSRYLIKKIILNTGIENIGDYAFYECSNLLDVKIPNGVISIGNNSFQYCKNLKDVQIPSSVMSIGRVAFSECSSLNNIMIPPNVTVINDQTFGYCSALTTIVLPSTLTRIGDFSFRNCYNLKNVSIPSDVTSIGMGAFADCSELTSIIIPSGVTSISDFLFIRCSKLTSITIPQNVTIISSGAFEECDSLTNITIPSNVETIGQIAFAGCQNLRSITISSSVSRIAPMAFSCCAALQDVYYTGSEEKWNDITIGKENESLINAKHHFSCGQNIVFYAGTNRKMTYGIADILSWQSSSVYNPYLAEILAGFSDAAYSKGDIEKTYDSFGFVNLLTENYDMRTYGLDDVGYCFGEKTLNDGTTMILVSLRGSLWFNDTALDWMSNFNLGSKAMLINGFHRGFYLAEEKVLSALKNYLGGTLDPSVKYVITGHSRGAAVGDLLEYKLSKEGISRDNIYGYNFACPDVGSFNDIDWHNMSQSNIFNINNQADPVSLLPGNLMDSIQISTNTILNFPLAHPHWGKIGISKWFFYKHFLIAIDAHKCENYIDFLGNHYALSGYFDRALIPPVGLKAVIRCPVDVLVKDQNGKTIAAVVNNVPQYYDSAWGDIIIFTDGEEKSIFINGDKQVSFHITGTGEGKMTFILDRNGLGEGQDSTGVKYFTNVGVKDGKEFVSSVTTDDTIMDTRLFVEDKGIQIAEIETTGEEKIFLQPASIKSLTNTVNGTVLKWNVVSNIDAYEIWRSSGGKAKKIATISNNKNSFTDKSTKKKWGMTYSYFVRTKKGSVLSEHGSGAVIKRLAPMRITSLKNNKSKTITVKWKLQTGKNMASGYQIQYATSKNDLKKQKGSFKKITVKGKKTLSRALKKLEKGKTYYIRIRAYSDCQNSITKKKVRTWSAYSTIKKIRVVR